MGITPADLVAESSAPTFGEVVAKVRTTLTPGTLRIYDTHLSWIASHRTRRNSRIAKGISVSKPAWSAGHYCHRCGYGFWPYPIAPGVPARQAITPENFRRIVWSSGGYANL
ncbi:hypothetical protein [Nocardia acidivorans]|uniref:hypothetical protein n=1 Tax=Nocardia acidivorans TaxID=404580 RepID=UPI000AF4F16B|nr:hypothetical protein [Nocardia acidivorans]